MVQALNTALRDAMADDDNVLVFGTDVATQGGVFRIGSLLGPLMIVVMGGMVGQIAASVLGPISGLANQIQ